MNKGGVQGVRGAEGGKGGIWESMEEGGEEIVHLVVGHVGAPVEEKR